MSFQRVPRVFRGLTACYQIQLRCTHIQHQHRKRFFFPFFEFCPCLCICSIWHIFSLRHHAPESFCFHQMFHLKFPRRPVLWPAQLFNKQSILHCEFHTTVYITQKILCKKKLLAKNWAHNLLKFHVFYYRHDWQKKKKEAKEKLLWHNVISTTVTHIGNLLYYNTA